MANAVNAGERFRASGIDFNFIRKDGGRASPRKVPAEQAASSPVQTFSGERMYKPLTVYIAASFRHKHGVRLLGRELAKLGCDILDWTAKASPPPGLTPAERRAWMDTDLEGGRVYAFCQNACLSADLLIYYGESGQDAGVEVGLGAAAGAPILGVRGPLEGPGLMLHGAVTAWVEDAEKALEAVQELLAMISGLENSQKSAAAQALHEKYKARQAINPQENP